MMGAAESFLRYFLAKIAAIIIFMNYVLGVHENKLFFCVLRIFNRPLRFSPGKARSPVSCAKTGENPEAARI
jgi:hypothetical protein